MQSVPRRMNSLNSSSLFSPIHQIFLPIRPSSARRHTEMKTSWHASTSVHAETHTHRLLCVLESTEGDKPRASCGPRRSLVWQTCTTLHFLHSSPCNSSKWPAWSPWISMSRMSGCKFCLVWCLSPAWLSKSLHWAGGGGGWRCWHGWVLLAKAFSHPKMKRTCHVRIGIGGSLQQSSVTFWSDSLAVTRWKYNC